MVPARGPAFACSAINQLSRPAANDAASIKVRFGEAAETKSPRRLLSEPSLILPLRTQPVSGSAGPCAVVQTLDPAAAMQK